MKRGNLNDGANVARSLELSTRKLRGAYYTKPGAAQLLACLGAFRGCARVVDPACGTGDLLLAALEVLAGQSGQPHAAEKVFLTGWDVMEGAVATARARLEKRAAKLGVKADISLTVGDALELAEVTSSSEKFDLAILNPPFTRRERLKGRKPHPRLVGRSGSSVNLWGEFLVLAADLVKPGGRVAAVVPSTLFRGKSTATLRQFAFTRLTPLAIVKPVAERLRSFSTDATLVDFLLVLEKTEGGRGDATGKVAIAFPRNSLEELDVAGVRDLAEEISRRRASGEGGDGGDDTVLLIPSRKFAEKCRGGNLAALVWGYSPERRRVVDDFWRRLRILAGRLLLRVEPGWLKEGVGLRPAGINEIACVTTPRSEGKSGGGTGRLRKAKQVLVGTTGEHLVVRTTGGGAELRKRIPKSATRPFLRTLTGLDALDATQRLDYLVVRAHPGLSETIGAELERSLAKFGEKWERVATRVVVPDKLNLASPNTKVLAVYSSRSFAPSNLAYSVVSPAFKRTDAAKALVAFLNSVASLAQFLRNHSTSLGSYARMKVDDWSRCWWPRLGGFSGGGLGGLGGLEGLTRELTGAFDALAKEPLPSLLEQLEGPHRARLELDRRVLAALGWPAGEANRVLERTYEALAGEIRALGSGSN
ncbi:MAG: hypothetical protein Kow0069_25800 [Promethearchaeota archaeon]